MKKVRILIISIILLFFSAPGPGDDGTTPPSDFNWSDIFPPGGEDTPPDDSGPKDVTAMITERYDKCVSVNPRATADMCWDKSYLDIAINQNNISICWKIKNDNVKSHCEGYFD